MKKLIVITSIFLAACSSPKKQEASDESLESQAPRIDREKVRQVIKGDITAFRTCYERELKADGKLQGKVVLGWDIDPTGKALNAKVFEDKSDLKNANVENCMVKEVSGLTFPPAPTATNVSIIFPFWFKNE